MLKKGLVLAVIVAMCSFNCYAAAINSSWVGGECGRWEEPDNRDDDMWGIPAIVPDSNGSFNLI